MVERITLNHAGMRQLLNGADMARDMLRRAQRVASVARAGAPVDTGEYRDSIRAEVVHTDRAVGRVVSDTDHTLVVEAKTRNLGRSLDAAGG